MPCAVAINRLEGLVVGKRGRKHTHRIQRMCDFRSSSSHCRVFDVITGKENQEIRASQEKLSELNINEMVHAVIVNIPRLCELRYRQGRANIMAGCQLLSEDALRDK